MIVASNGQYAAMATGSKSIGMFKHVHASVDAGAFAIPHAENAVVLGAFKQVGLLAAPNRRGCEVFVDAGLEMYVVLPCMLARQYFPTRSLHLVCKAFALLCEMIPQKHPNLLSSNRILNLCNVFLYERLQTFR